MATRPEHLYEDDFYAWTRDQAGALRQLADQRWNGPLDLLHLAAEVEDLGTAARNTVRTQLQRIIEHALKLEYSPAAEPRNGWLNSIDDARGELEQAITPAIRAEVQPRLQDLYAKRAAKPPVTSLPRAKRMPPAPCRRTAPTPSMTCSPTSGGPAIATACGTRTDRAPAIRARWSARAVCVTMPVPAP